MLDYERYLYNSKKKILLLELYSDKKPFNEKVRHVMIANTTRRNMENNIIFKAMINRY